MREPYIYPATSGGSTGKQDSLTAGTETYRTGKQNSRPAGHNTKYVEYIHTYIYGPTVYKDN